MALPTLLSPTILAATVNQIAPLFMPGANGDHQAAREAVTALLADYKPQTNEELTLAADIVHYRFLAADNLARSSDPELSLTKVLRLRGSAVSLSREAHKAQRKLDKLQAIRASATPQPAAQPQAAASETAATSPNQPVPPTQAELATLQTAREILNGKKPITASTFGGKDAAQQMRKRLMVQTMNENAARRAAEHARKIAEQAAAQVALSNISLTPIAERSSD
jgi:hypothetical protein